MNVPHSKVLSSSRSLGPSQSKTEMIMCSNMNYECRSRSDRAQSDQPININHIVELINSNPILIGDRMENVRTQKLTLKSYGAVEYKVFDLKIYPDQDKMTQYSELRDYNKYLVLKIIISLFRVEQYVDIPNCENFDMNALNKSIHMGFYLTSDMILTHSIIHTNTLFLIDHPILSVDTKTFEYMIRNIKTSYEDFEIISTYAKYKLQLIALYLFISNDNINISMNDEQQVNRKLSKIEEILGEI